MADPTLNIANRTLYHGDNLPFLRGINSGTIHLIATDPPFNKGRNHISNHILLCGPCNHIKSNTLMLSGLRKENAKRGRMAGR